MNLNTAGSIIDELSRIVQRPNHVDGGRKPESTKVAKISHLKKACNFLCESCIAPQVFKLRTQVGATGRDVGPILLAPFLPLTPEESDRPCDVTLREGSSRLFPGHCVSSTRSLPYAL